MYCVVYFPLHCSAASSPTVDAYVIGESYSSPHSTRLNMLRGGATLDHSLCAVYSRQGLSEIYPASYFFLCQGLYPLSTTKAPLFSVKDFFNAGADLKPKKTGSATE